jgi:hypothetical protein
LEGDFASIFIVEKLKLVLYLAYSSTLKMEATYSSETLVGFQQTTRRYIPEDITLYLQLFNKKNNALPWKQNNGFNEFSNKDFWKDRTTGFSIFSMIIKVKVKLSL